MHPKMPLHSSFTRNPMLRSLRVARSIRIPTTFGITTFAADRCEPPTFSGCAADDVAPLTKMHAATADTITTAAVRIAPPSIRCPDLSDPTPAIVSAQPHDQRGLVAAWSRSTRTNAVPPLRAVRATPHDRFQSSPPACERSSNAGARDRRKREHVGWLSVCLAFAVPVKFQLVGLVG